MRGIRGRFESRSSPFRPHFARRVSPGAVATELPNHITDRDAAASIGKFYEGFAIPAESFARAVVFALSQPEDVDVNEILFRPTRQEL